MAIQILYEDACLIALSKPSGQVVIPGRGDLPGEPLVTELEKHAGHKIYVVHRLDRGASGLILFAKDASTHPSFRFNWNAAAYKKAISCWRKEIWKPGASSINRFAPLVPEGSAFIPKANRPDRLSGPRASARRHAIGCKTADGTAASDPRSFVFHRAPRHGRRSLRQGPARRRRAPAHAPCLDTGVRPSGRRPFNANRRAPRRFSRRPASVSTVIANHLQ